MDDYIQNLQSPHSTDDQGDDLVKKIDAANESFDRFVAALLGDENFNFVKSSLEAFNSQVCDRSPVKVRFVSAW